MNPSGSIRPVPSVPLDETRTIAGIHEDMPMCSSRCSSHVPSPAKSPFVVGMEHLPGGLTTAYGSFLCSMKCRINAGSTPFWNRQNTRNSILTSQKEWSS